MREIARLDPGPGNRRAAFGRASWGLWKKWISFWPQSAAHEGPKNHPVIYAQGNRIYGIFIAPFAGYLFVALLIFIPVRMLFDRYAIQRWVWHRPFSTYPFSLLFFRSSV
jgi:hypothetical protein